MRKIIFQMLISLDGFFEGPNREIDWHNVDAEFNEHAVDFLDRVDTLVFGRVTYDLMAAYWPTAEAIKGDPLVAARMNALPKIVFSKTLRQAHWRNTRLVAGDAAHEMTKLKKQPGADLAVFGSSDLALTLIENGLIDEFRILVNPIVLGGGKSLFQGIPDRVKLKLIDTKRFQSGNVLLCYEPAEKLVRV